MHFPPQRLLSSINVLGFPDVDRLPSKLYWNSIGENPQCLPQNPEYGSLLHATTVRLWRDGVERLTDLLNQ